VTANLDRAATLRLLGALHAPELAGAACVGRARLFDPPAEREPAADVAFRRRQAVALCRACTALASCQQWFNDLPRAKRPSGVVAGQITPASPGRPRKETA